MLMPKYSDISHKRLATCDIRLQKLFNEVIKYFDCSIIVGYRNQIDQDLAFQKDRSKLKYPNSKHNKRPSLAIDVAPYPIIFPDREKDPKGYTKAVSRFYFFAGYVIATGQYLSIPVRFGGDWDGDFDIFDQTFDDLCHFELEEVL